MWKKFTSTLPVILFVSAALCLSGGVVNYKLMAAYDTFSTTNWGITAGWFLATLLLGSISAVTHQTSPGNVLQGKSAAVVKSLRKQAAALNSQADQMTAELEAEAEEAKKP